MVIGKGGVTRMHAHLCPCTKYAAIFFFRIIFPNSLGSPLLFSAAIWFSILLTDVIKLCIHSGHFSCLTVEGCKRREGNLHVYLLASFPCSAGQEEDQIDTLFSDQTCRHKQFTCKSLDSNLLQRHPGIKLTFKF